MKISNQNVSAFAIYSEQLKQKKKSKHPPSNGVDKIKKKHGKRNKHEGRNAAQSNKLSPLELKEISNIMQTLCNQSNSNGMHVPSTSESVNANENIAKKLGEEFTAQLKECNLGNHQQKVQNEHSVKPDVSEKSLPGKKRRNRNRKFSKENSIKGNKVVKINITKETTHLQSSKIKPPNQEIEVSLSGEEEDNRDTNELFKGSVKSSRRRKLDSRISQSNLSINENQNLLKKKKNKANLTNGGKILKSKQSKKVNLKIKSQSVKGSKFSINETVRDNSELDEKDHTLKPKKIEHSTIVNDDWITQEDSNVAAKIVFESIISPVREKHFMRTYWEKQLLLVQRKEHRAYYSELISILDIDSMLRKNNVQFTKHLDITSYRKQKRETHNLPGRAQPNVVWDFYSDGCSIRLLNPQEFLPKIHTLNSALQGYFGCYVGANVYLTPPNSQGFAPHYDDIEAFVLQIEGKKHWKVYLPRFEREALPRESSRNFNQDEIGEPVLDVTLEPGDMLYFPRGFIHQASTVEGEHSLHITLSAYQKTAWVDLLEKAIPRALKRASDENIEFRRGLPRNYLDLEFHGDEKARLSFLKTADRLMMEVVRILPLTLGVGVDKMGVQFMHDALPPVFTPGEKQHSSVGGGLKVTENGKLFGRLNFDLETEIKLIRANICRLAVEDDGELRLYHCLDNSLEYHGLEQQYLVLPPEGYEVVATLATNYPNYTKLKAFTLNDKRALIALVMDLWDDGLLMARNKPH